MTSLVPSGPSDERELRALHAKATELDAQLTARSAEFARLDSDLTAFKIRYRHEVGRLHEQLDELELAIAEAELGEIAKRLEADDAGAKTPAGDPLTHSAPRFTSDAVRRLFRDVAKAIHPDLARDADARDRRHRLMIEANRAYALGDEGRLRLIRQVWERSLEAVQGSDAEAARLRLVRRIAQLEEELEISASELAELQEAPLWKLKTMVDDAWDFVGAKPCSGLQPHACWRAL